MAVKSTASSDEAGIGMEVKVQEADPKMAPKSALLEEKKHQIRTGRRSKISPETC